MFRDLRISDHNLLILFQVIRLTPDLCYVSLKICVKQISNYKKHVILFIVLLQKHLYDYQKIYVVLFFL